MVRSATKNSLYVGVVVSQMIMMRFFKEIKEMTPLTLDTRRIWRLKHLAIQRNMILQSLIISIINKQQNLSIYLVDISLNKN